MTLGVSPYTTQRAKMINAIIIKLKKKAPIPIRIAINTVEVNTIESAAKLVIIVPQIPIKRQVIFNCKHFIKALDLVMAPTNIAATRIIKPSTPNPKAIQTEVTMFGIYPKANSIPIIIPIIILIRTAAKSQAKNRYLLLQFDIFYLLFRYFMSTYLYNIRYTYIMLQNFLFALQSKAS